jgi:phenylpyruvate tautomerase PptA (4-oxalocrotonate tautomerase family)
MNTGSEIEFIEEFQQLELVAFGCNRRVYRKLEESLAELGIHSFSFCEYFPVEPIPLVSDGSNKLPGSVSFLFPFARRYNLRTLFPKDVQLFPRIENNKIEYWEKITAELRRKDTIAEFYNPLELPITLKPRKKHFDTPKLINKLIKQLKKGKLISEEPKEVLNAKDIVYIKNKNLDDFFEYIKNAPDEQKEQIKKEWLTMDREWWWYLQGGDERGVTFIYTPVASNYYLYGVLQLTIAREEITIKNGNRTRDDKNKKEKIAHILWEIAKEDYLPLLIIFHNYRKEKRLKDSFKKENSDNISKKVEDSRGEWLNRVDEECLHPLEKVFKGMWDYREQRAQEVAKGNSLEEIFALIMADYLVASPGMMKQLQTALTLSLQSTGKYIPSVLIVGGSGAGKELMAKLVARYSADFREAFYKPFNLAEGFYAHEPGASEKLIDRLTKVFSDAENEGADSVVLVFDELNSLPLEVQGTLLRIMENKEELIALLSTTNRTLAPNQLKVIINYLKNTKILLIGLINEDPEKLTKLPIMRELFRERGIISGLLEDIVYEQILKLRRLRGDLYFRIIRNGKIVIPDLKKRREDLPILFYTFLKRELGNKNLIIEYEAFDEIMDERIEWRGNIRELQAVCKTVAQLLTKREEIKVKKDDNTIKEAYVVSRFKVRKALREHRLLEE